MSDLREVLMQFYDHLVVRGGGYIDVAKHHADDALFIEWVKEKLREEFEEEE